jgi:hypothetical protein
MESAIISFTGSESHSSKRSCFEFCETVTLSWTYLNVISIL